MKIDLSICIVSWDTETLLKECLRSIFERTKGISCEVFVVDNASKDGTVKMVREHFSDVSLIVNHENKVFAAANNQAVRLAKGRHVIFQSPDTVVLGDALQTMVQFMDGHPEAGAVGCKPLNADGSIQRSTKRLLTSSIILYDSTILGRIFFQGKTQELLHKESLFDKVEEVDGASALPYWLGEVFDDVGLTGEGYFIFLSR